MDMLLIIFSLTDMKHDVLLISAKSLNELCINISDLLIIIAREGLVLRPVFQKF